MNSVDAVAAVEGIGIHDRAMRAAEILAVGPGSASICVPVSPDQLAAIARHCGKGLHVGRTHVDENTGLLCEDMSVLRDVGCVIVVFIAQRPASRCVCHGRCEDACRTCVHEQPRMDGEDMMPVEETKPASTATTEPA